MNRIWVQVHFKKSVWILVPGTWHITYCHEFLRFPSYCERNWPFLSGSSEFHVNNCKSWPCISSSSTVWEVAYVVSLLHPCVSGLAAILMLPSNIHCQTSFVCLLLLQAQFNLSWATFIKVLGLFVLDLNKQTRTDVNYSCHLLNGVAVSYRVRQLEIILELFNKIWTERRLQYKRK